MKKKGHISPLGWVAIIAGGIIVLDVIAGVASNTMQYGPNPQQDAANKKAFEDASNEVKQTITNELNGYRRVR
jgi:hypothetical protein